MWMNESEIDEAVRRFATHPVLGPAARFLEAFKDQVNGHSDGWPYWTAPSKAANKLMTWLAGHLRGGMGAYPRLSEPTEAEFRKTLAPIKAFYTRRGYAAGMVMPPLDTPPPAPAGQRTVKAFKVALVSRNQNSFGLWGVIVVAEDGMAFQVGASALNLPAKGAVLSCPYAGEDYDWGSLGFEIPDRLPPTPAALTAEIWK